MWILIFFAIGSFIGVGAVMLLYVVAKIIFHIIYFICSLFDDSLN